MKIYGLQKMTLLDYPGHVACTVFLNGCDFRCPFCHNYELATGVATPIMDEDEVIAFLRKRTGLLDGVAITGGEPCLSAGLSDFLRDIHSLGFLTKLDTNGYHPDILQHLMNENLIDYVAMDIKNSPEKYALTAGIPSVDMAKITQSIDLLRNGTVDYEFRTTVVKELHEDKDFEMIGKMIRGAKRYYLQQFTDRDSVPFSNMSAPSLAQMEAFSAIVKKYVPETTLRGVE